MDCHYMRFRFGVCTLQYMAKKYGVPLNILAVYMKKLVE